MRALSKNPEEKKAHPWPGLAAHNQRRSVREVEEIINRFRIQTIRAQLELRRIICASLGNKLDKPQFSAVEPSMIAKPWQAVLAEGDAPAFYLDLLRRHAKEGKLQTEARSQQERSSI